MLYNVYTLLGFPGKENIFNMVHLTDELLVIHMLSLMNAMYKYNE